MSAVRFRRAEVAGRLVDVRCADGRVTDVAPSVPAADVTVDADGGALLPGLHDHHIHLFALAAARTSVDLASVLTPGGFDETVRVAAVASGSSWLRVIGYHESVHGPLDRHRLDALAPDRCVRVQHRTGAMWVLNTRGLQQFGPRPHRCRASVDAIRPGGCTGSTTSSGTASSPCRLISPPRRTSWLRTGSRV